MRGDAKQPYYFRWQCIIVIRSYCKRMGNYTHPFCLSKCRQSNTETLVISGALDHRTPAEIVDTALMPFSYQWQTHHP